MKEPSGCGDSSPLLPTSWSPLVLHTGFWERGGLSQVVQLSGQDAGLTIAGQDLGLLSQRDLCDLGQWFETNTDLGSRLMTEPVINQAGRIAKSCTLLFETCICAPGHGVTGPGALQDSFLSIRALWATLMLCECALVLCDALAIVPNEALHEATWRSFTSFHEPEPRSRRLLTAHVNRATRPEQMPWHALPHGCMGRNLPRGGGSRRGLGPGNGDPSSRRWMLRIDWETGEKRGEIFRPGQTASPGVTDPPDKETRRQASWMLALGLGSEGQNPSGAVDEARVIGLTPRHLSQDSTARVRTRVASSAHVVNSTSVTETSRSLTGVALVSHPLLIRHAIGYSADSLLKCQRDLQWLAKALQFAR
ncbi:hypothetical protein G7046_g9772 [Stylonectria norvegica]|nr:hypothetical protein G7046_g9772 [Stylonectria norvegica]